MELNLSAYNVLNWLHIVSAAVLIGGIAFLPFLRREAQRAGDPSVADHTLRVLDRASNRLIMPAVVLLFVTGILMVAGPFARWNMFVAGGRWILAGLSVWIVLAAAVGFVAGVVKQMLPRPGKEPALRRLGGLWRQFRWGVVASAFLALLAEAIMVLRPVF